ncbi:ribonuclease M5 [Terrilactibacillus laevilacticus]|uniref:ribonuclease M5 n=1 Tax=Terrilactibacillus laevilacticus TaxID=1380157 RepID=UPI0015EED4BB|nr:ribonuclease M5 [Terrilactibacillus laevilacticus]
MVVIKEIIVVEGKCDTLAIKNAVEADTIETNGSAVDRDVLEMIQRAQDKRGVIIFTDPDYPGERIRKIVSSSVKGCKHAFLTKQEAKGRPNESLGIEHAKPEAIREALQDVYTETEETQEYISMTTLREYGLIAGQNARKRRERLGEKLKIGYTNAKQLHKRLRIFQVTPAEFHEALKAVIEEEKHE